MTYAELHCASAFSFLEGASQPEDLVDRAVELGLPAVALVDRNTLSGAPRFWKAAREAGIKPLVGAEVVLDDNSQFSILNSQLPSQAHPGARCDAIHNSKFIIHNSAMALTPQRYLIHNPNHNRANRRVRFVEDLSCAGSLIEDEDRFAGPGINGVEGDDIVPGRFALEIEEIHQQHPLARDDGQVDGRDHRSRDPADLHDPTSLTWSTIPMIA
jgi:hypothetical protein